MNLLVWSRCRPPLLGIFLASSVALSSSSLHAEGLTDSLAVSFKNKGDEAMNAGDYTAAVEAYGKGARIQSHPVFDFNLARALQALGRFAEALDCLERFERDASNELRAKVPAFDVLLDNLRENVGLLVLEGDAVDARVFGDGRDLGRFESGKALRCNRGTLELLVKAEGYQPISQRVSIDSQQTTRVKLQWFKLDDRANVTILASIPAARVFIDERFVGQTPVDTKLPPGTHHLRLEHDDASTLETDVVVSPRESRRLSLEMQKHAPIWSKWWFWTGAAALATGLVVAGVALSTSKSPTPGDIQPGIVSAPLFGAP